MVNALSAAVLSPTGIAIVSVEALALAILLAILIVLVIKTVKIKKLPKDEYTLEAEDGDSSEETAADLCGAEGLNLTKEKTAAEVCEEGFIKKETSETGAVGLNETIREEFTIEELSFAKSGEHNLKEEENAREDKITFSSKLEEASEEIRGYYDEIKSELLSYKGVRSRLTIGGDYFRIPNKPLAKIILIGTTLRLALALDPEEFDYKIYHQHDRSGMKKYADTPMFIKLRSKLGIERAKGLIAVMMDKNGVKKAK